MSLFLTLLVCGGLVSAQRAAAQDPGWSPVIIPTGDYRNQIKSMPIEQRPYRPLHFYGNTVRRSYYRGTPYTQLAERQSATVQSYRPTVPTPSYSVQPAPYQPAPYQPAPYQSAPVQPAPYQSAPYQSAPYQSAPYQSAPVQSWSAPAW